jgi:hypothetical protein
MMLAFTEELPISYPSNSIISYLRMIGKYCDFQREGIKVRNKRIFAKRGLKGNGRKACYQCQRLMDGS